MLTYNTHRDILPLPQYGRYAQDMVEFCRTIEDRRERQLCANTIIKLLSTLFPPEAGEEKEEYNRRLWDHLAIMSHFDLDIDWPYDVVKENPAATAPEKVPYVATELKRRNYGRLAQNLAAAVSDMEDGADKDALALLVANHLKKLSLAWGSGEAAPDNKVIADLRAMTHGKVNLDDTTVHLHEFSAAPVPATSKKKKRRKK